MTTKTKNIIRWILLPLTVAGAWLAIVAAVTYMYISIPHTYNGAGYTAEALGIFFMGILLGWLMSLMPVYFVARAVAPNFKVRTAVISSFIIASPILFVWVTALAKELIQEIQWMF